MQVSIQGPPTKTWIPPPFNTANFPLALLLNRGQGARNSGSLLLFKQTPGQKYPNSIRLGVLDTTTAAVWVCWEFSV